MVRERWCIACPRTCPWLWWRLQRNLLPQMQEYLLKRPTPARKAQLLSQMTSYITPYERSRSTKTSAPITMSPISIFPMENMVYSINKLLWFRSSEFDVSGVIHVNDGIFKSMQLIYQFLYIEIQHALEVFYVVSVSNFE